MNNQDNMLPPEQRNPFAICPKKTEVTEEQDDFNIAIMNMFNMLISSKILNENYENTNTWFN